MLTLLRLLFSLRHQVASLAPGRWGSFSWKRLRGSAPRARQGKAPAGAGADPRGLPGLPRFSSILFSKAWHSLVQTRTLCLKGGRSPSARLALALATPGLADGQGRRREVRALHP